MLSPDTIAQRYAQHLLHATGAMPLHAPVAPARHPALAWRRSGLMALTGRPEAAPAMCLVPLTAIADGALVALAALAPAGALGGDDGAALLAERAAIAGHTRRGAVSPGGACRLLATRDGAIALNLARDEDRELLPAWLQRDDLRDDAAIGAALREQTMHDLVERGRELGLAVAPVVPPPTPATAWCETLQQGPRATAVRAAPRVLDLSSLWAGPLCAQLLRLCGADVVKLESRQRPDGARRGPPPFFDRLNAGKRSVALDFTRAEERARLRALIERADIVIEASRPRALRQLGIDAEALIDARPGLTWISLTGYGRGGARENWIAYGDDAGVAAGLTWLMRQATGELLFVGDAIADPLTGLHAALAAWATHRAGGGRLLSLSLVDVVRHALQFERPADAEALRARQRDWAAQACDEVPAAPQAPVSRGTAPALGADNDAVLRDWGVTC
ncbi:MAG: CoA transferase [Nevskiaceae bacterium]|nr:MAG: CoA transferase [Nevskiaceae bacterium]